MNVIDDIQSSFEWIEKKVDNVQPGQKVGRVVEVTGLIVESEGPEVSLGDLVEIYSKFQKDPVSAEVVGFKDNKVLLMPLGELNNVHPGCKVIASTQGGTVPLGQELLGRIIDGLGKPIDGKGLIQTKKDSDLNSEFTNPMNRSRIDTFLETGVKAIDMFAPIGHGQRMGIFAGSGVGKSSLLGMIARGASADVNVIGLIGERGRELKEFIEVDLGQEGLGKSVIVISTSDQPAPLRIRAALLAARVAEYFRDEGKSVLLLMDSITRFAMAQREIGLAIGEPPASRGYTPSVFSKLSRLVERSGKLSNGSITGLYTVLVEGDDMNEPIADAVRGLLDGHLVLSRSLATANHYPSVDVSESVSRLMRQVCSNDHIELISQARDLLALYKRNEDLINVGAYAVGTNAKIDKSIKLHKELMMFLKQSIDKRMAYGDSIKSLEKILE